MQARNAESETSRQTRDPKRPARLETSEQRIPAINGEAASIQSPHTEALAVPYAVTNTATCSRMSAVAIPMEIERSLDITDLQPLIELERRLGMRLRSEV